MMRFKIHFKILLFFLFSFVLIKATAQENYLPYYEDINTAERLFTENKIDSAYLYYDKAFADYDFVFAKDAFIAAQISYKHNDINRTKRYLAIGGKSGLSMDCIRSSGILKGMIGTPLYDSVDQIVSAGNDQFSKRVNKKLFQEWANRFAEEQEFKKMERDQYENEVRENVAAIRKLLKEHVFPADKVIGLEYDCETLGNYFAFYSLAHYDCAISELKLELWEAVKRGELHPRDFAALCEFERLRKKSVPREQYINDNCLNKPAMVIKFNLTWFNDTDSASLEEVKRNRKQYALCDLQTDKKKKELEETEGYELFFGYR